MQLQNQFLINLHFPGLRCCMFCAGTMDPKKMWNYVKSPPAISVTGHGMRVLHLKGIVHPNILILSEINDNFHFWMNYPYNHCYFCT